MSNPTDTPESERKAAAKELLLADHGYFSQLFLRNEQIGETRVNWFIGIVTGAAGGLFALNTKSGLPEGVNRLVTIAALIALLLFGVVTLFRIIQRNRTTDGFKKDLDNVRQVFRDHYDPERVLMDYQPLGSPRKKPLNPNEIEQPPGGRKFGGLAYTVASINSLLAAALAAAIICSLGNTVSALVPLIFNEVTESNSLLAQMLAATTIQSALAALVFSFVVQAVLITAREEASKLELRAGGVTHAGGVVFKRSPDNEAVEYLIVRPKPKSKDKSKDNDKDNDKDEDKSDDVISAKGPVEDGENHAETAPSEGKETDGLTPPQPGDKADEWVLPKGHVEAREHHAQAALREVLEETGVRARVIRMIDTVEYKTDTGKFVKVKFYLMEKLFDGEPSEKREREWFPYPTVLDELTHEESKHVVRMAEKIRRRES